MSLLCLSMCLIHIKLPSSTTPHPPRHPCLLFPILIFHTRSVMHLDYIAVIIDSGQVAYLAGIFYKVIPKNVWFISKCQDFEIPFLSTFAIPNAPKSENMLYIEQKKKSRRHEPSKLKKYPIRRKDIV